MMESLTKEQRRQMMQMMSKLRSKKYGSRNDSQEVSAT